MRLFQCITFFNIFPSSYIMLNRLSELYAWLNFWNISSAISVDIISLFSSNRTQYRRNLLSIHISWGSIGSVIFISPILSSPYPSKNRSSKSLWNLTASSTVLPLKINLSSNWRLLFRTASIFVLLTTTTTLVTLLRQFQKLHYIMSTLFDLYASENLLKISLATSSGITSLLRSNNNQYKNTSLFCHTSSKLFWLFILFFWRR